jgi:hypothetical protein
MAAHPTDSSSYWDAVANIATGIRLFEIDGFKLGSHGTVNASGVTYYYIAARNTK